MSPERPRNLAASVRECLLNRARGRREDFNYLLTRYANERLLFRLAESAHRDQFVLKGATLFELWHDAVSRATRDVDLLGLPGVLLTGPQNSRERRVLVTASRN